jgi:D-lactate dehydrogenase
MTDQERLAALVQQLNELAGLKEEQYLRLISEISRASLKDGHDEQGRLRVVVFDAKSYDEDSLEKLNQNRFAFQYVRPRLSPHTIQAAAGAKVVCLFVNDACDAGVLDSLKALGVELIALRCAGFNNVDLAACQRLGISVVRVPAYSPYAVAEHTAALMLMLNRHLHQAYQRNRAGYFVLEGLTGFDMHGKTAGVVGTGKIGQCLIDILRGFGCHILAFDKFPTPREGVRYVELDQLWRESDIISLHVPLFSETKYLINQQAIEQMKPGVMLINTSRGGLVDTRALIAGLKSGKIGSAGLDVYEEEAGIFFQDVSDKILSDDVLARLMTFHNVVVTSHQAFLTREALGNIAETTLANITEYAQGKRQKELTNHVG